MNEWTKFFQIRKVDEEKRLVYARLAQEIEDKSGEIMDYGWSKPNFEKWVKESEELSKGKSQGNLRAMHGKVAAGKFINIECIDEEKAVDTVFKVIDNNEWEKVLEGVYTGLSMGGSYGKKEKVGNLLRYEAIPNEGSLVDRPCIPTATFFEIQKADGSLAKIDFKQISKGDDMKIKLTEELKKYLGQEVWDAGQALSALSSIYDLLAGELSEGHEEAPEQITALKAAIENLKVFIAAEIKEDSSETADAGGMVMAEKAGDMKKNDPEPTPQPEPEPTPIETKVDLSKAGARHSKSDTEKIQTVHDHSVDLGAMCKSAEKIEAEHADALKKIEAEKTDALQKMESDLKKIQGERDEALKKIEDLTAESTLLKAEIEKLKKEPEPAKGIKKVVTITKVDDTQDAAPLQKLEDTAEFKKADDKTKALLKMKESLQHPEFMTFAK
jgi:hypothetical protein